MRYMIVIDCTRRVSLVEILFSPQNVCMSIDVKKERAKQKKRRGYRIKKKKRGNELDISYECDEGVSDIKERKRLFFHTLFHSWATQSEYLQQEGGGGGRGSGRRGKEDYYLVSVQYTMWRYRKTQDARRRRVGDGAAWSVQPPASYMLIPTPLMCCEDREGGWVRGDSPVDCDSNGTSHAENGASSTEKIQAD